MRNLILLITLAILSALPLHAQNSSSMTEEQANARLKEILPDHQALMQIWKILESDSLTDIIATIKNTNKTHINVVPKFNCGDTALVPALLQFYFDIRKNTSGAYIDMVLTFKPTGPKWYSFDQYKITGAFQPGPGVTIPPAAIKEADEVLNAVLSALSNLFAQSGTLSRGLLSSLQKLSSTMGVADDPYFNGKILPEVEFTANASDKYGFDAWLTGAPPAAKYDTEKVNGNDAKIAWKSATQGQTTLTTAVLRQTSRKAAGATFQFRPGSGLSVNASPQTDTSTLLRITPTGTGSEKVEAWYVVTDSTKKKHEKLLRTLAVESYEGLSRELVVVPVGNVSLPAAFTSALKQSLTNAYAPAAVTWSVTVASSNLSYSNWDTDGDNLFTFSKSFTDWYSADQKALIAEYKDKDPSVSTSAYYVFVLPGDVPRNKDFSGYMPFKAQWGFVFYNGSTNFEANGKLIAHELGHGAFRLEHITDPPTSATDNLMDYAAGTRTYHSQWEYIYDPSWKLYLFGKEEDAAGKDEDKNLAISISEKAKEIAAKLNTEVFAVIHIASCSSTIPLKDQVKEITNFTKTDYELRKPLLLKTWSKNSKVWTVLYFSNKAEILEGSTNLNTSNADKLTINGVSKCPFLGYEISPFTNVIECSSNDNINLFACNSGDEYFASLNKAERVNSYVDFLLEAISKCIDDQSNDKVGDRFYREMVLNATSDQDKADLRKIADVYNQIGDVLLTKNNTEGWGENGDFFKNSYDTYKKLKGSLDEYLAQLNKYKEAYEEEKEKLASLTDNEKIAIAVNAYSIKEIEYLPLSLRMRCIKFLASERMRGNINLFGNNEEFAVLRLLKYVPSRDIAQLLKELKTNDLLARLDCEYDDLEFFAGDENYGKLIDILDTYILTNKGVTEENKKSTLDELYYQNKVYNITRGADGVKYLSSSFINSKAEVSITVSTINGYSYAGYPPVPIPNIKNEAPLSISFDDLTGVHHNGYIKGIDLEKKGQIELVSALKLHYYLSCHKNEDVKTTISVLIDVGSLALGAGELTASIKSIQFIFAVLDVSSSASSLVTTAVEDQLVDTYGADGQKYVNYMRGTSALLGFTDLGGRGFTKLRSILKDDIVTVVKVNKAIEKTEDLKTVYTKTDELLDDLAKGVDELADVFVNGWTKEKILALPKGSRPQPSEYLKPEYISNHISKFEQEGTVSRIVLKDAYNKYGIGKPDIGKTEFVSLKSDIDKLIKDANGNLDILSQTLGVPKEQLAGGLVRIDFKVTSKYKVYMSSGNEFGTNSQWLPGGKLPTGQVEAVVKTEGMIKDVDYFVIDIK
jgi:hypothetical protein